MLAVQNLLCCTVNNSINVWSSKVIRNMFFGTAPAVRSEGLPGSVCGFSPEAIEAVNRVDLVKGLALLTLLNVGTAEAAMGSPNMRFSLDLLNLPESDSPVDRGVAFDLVGLNRFSFNRNPDGDSKMLDLFVRLSSNTPQTPKRDEVLAAAPGATDHELARDSAALYVLGRLKLVKFSVEDGKRQMVAPLGIVAALMYETRDAASSTVRSLHRRFPLRGEGGMIERVQTPLKELRNLKQSGGETAEERNSAYWLCGTVAINEAAQHSMRYDPALSLLAMLQQDFQRLDFSISLRGSREGEYGSPDIYAY